MLVMVSLALVALPPPANGASEGEMTVSVRVVARCRVSTPSFLTRDGRSGGEQTAITCGTDTPARVEVASPSLVEPDVALVTVNF